MNVKPLQGGGFMVSFQRDGKMYIWKSSNHTLKGPNKNMTHVRMSNIFGKANRARIRKDIPVSSTVVRKRSPINVKRHRQTGGTCWFHAAINGLLMSPIARKIVKERLRFINRGERFSNIGGQSIFMDQCPSSTITRDSLFWDYIRKRLEGGRGTIKTNNSAIIKSSGLRRNTNVRGGNFTDMYNLYKKLFPGDYKVSFIGNSTPSFVFKTGNKFKPIETHHGHSYILSHSYITMTGPASIHIVAGFIDRSGSHKIYDSASDKFYTFDWTRQFSQFGKYTEGIHKVAVYVRVTN